MEFPPEVLDKAEAAKERLDIHIHYSPHGSRQDLAQAETMIRSREFDIYAPELPFCPPSMNPIWHKIAKGDRKTFAQASEILRRSERGGAMALASIAIFYACKTPIILPDITAEEGFKYGVDNLGAVDLHFQFDGFERDYQRTKEEVHKHAKNIYYRDHIIATRMPALAMDLIDSTPHIKTKENISVLATLGSRHTMVSHLLRKKGYQVSRSFNVKPQVLTHLDAAAKKVALGREASEKEYIDAFKEFILFYPLTKYMIDHPQDNAANFMFTRKVADMLSDEQAEELYGLMKEDNADRYKEISDKLIASVEV